MLLIHSILRWIVVILGIVVIVKFAAGWLGRKPFTALDARLAMLFSMAMDIQILAGLILLVWSGVATAIGFPRYRLEHAFMMILALAAVHIPARWRKSGDAIRFRNTLLAFVLAIVFVAIGVSLLPGGGWARAFPAAFSLP